MEEANWADSHLLHLTTSVNGETAGANAARCFFLKSGVISKSMYLSVVVVMFIFLHPTLANFLNS